MYKRGCVWVPVLLLCMSGCECTHVGVNICAQELVCVFPCVCADMPMSLHNECVSVLRDLCLLCAWCVFDVLFQHLPRPLQPHLMGRVGVW